MKWKRKLILSAILVIILVASSYYFPDHLKQYSRYIYYPFQSFRHFLFGHIPFSVGDVLYFLGGLWLLATIIKCIRYLIHFRQYKEQLGLSVLNIINSLLFIYLFFLLGWGLNYEQDPLREFWKLDDTVQDTDSPPSLKLRRMKDSLALVAFNQFLVDKLNTCAPHYRALSFREVNERAKAYYNTYTDSKVRSNGLEVKPTLFSYFIQRSGIDGYYNPFTGEGQVNNDLPAFQLPFVICHEMAHQAGIAAEGDANLMAYAIGTMPDDASFNYSCYLNIWLYANHRLYRRDSTVAKAFEARLNALTTAHIDTLEELSRKYNGAMTYYSSNIYDTYLKMQDQKEGIKSYGNVSTSAWQLELKRKDNPMGIIKVPGYK